SNDAIKPLVAKATITINVLDLNEAPAFTSPATLQFYVAEKNKAGATVGTVKAVDPDKHSPKDTLTYAIVKVNGVNGTGPFAIDPVKGTITVPTAGALNFEMEDTYSVLVRVSDGNGGITQQTFTVHVQDVNEAGVFTLLDKNGVAAPTGLMIHTAGLAVGD